VAQQKAVADVEAAHGVHLHASEGGAEACGRPSLIGTAIRDP
jgi:hypothetical protein